MKEWWQNLSQREQYISLAGSIFVGLLIIYFYIWQPFFTALDTLRERIQYEQHIMRLMQQAQGQIHQQVARKVREKVDTGQLLSVLASNLKQSKLSPYSHQITQTADGKIRLAFVSVPFDPFMLWLDQFWQAYKFEITHLETTPLPETGTVKLTIVFKA